MCSPASRIIATLYEGSSVVISHDIRSTFKVLSRAAWKVYSDTMMPPRVAEEMHDIDGAGTQGIGTRTDAGRIFMLMSLLIIFQYKWISYRFSSYT